MTPEEIPDLEAPRKSTPALEPRDVEALVQHYRSRHSTRQQRRRWQMLAAIGGLLGCVALVAGLSIVLQAQRNDAPSTPEALTPRAVPPRQTEELRPPPSGPSVTPPGDSAAKALAPPTPAPGASPPGPQPTAVTIGYQPLERLAAVQPGDAKDRVFDLFGGTVDRRNGTLVRIPGMRLRATGRSPDHAQVEIGEVEIADTGTGTRYWFLFGDGRLVAWGRPEEWPAAVTRYQLELDER